MTKKVAYYMALIRETWEKYDSGRISSEIRDQNLTYFVEKIEEDDEDLAEKLRQQYNLKEYST